ncbi:MAG: alternative ribosome rescue aminoacyl-tRNA hydrolase ArfB [Patescibacteria group bacterium]
MFNEPTNNSRPPENELVITFARSSGAGGQNVNKTATKAIIHWAVGSSVAFSDAEKQLIREKLTGRLNNADEIVVDCEEERSQPRNREIAIGRLRDLIVAALRVPKLRRPTRPTGASKIKRLAEKKIRSKIKSDRRMVVE